MRKTVERAIDYSIKKVTRFLWTESSFRSSRGIEHPVLRFETPMHSGHNHLAVLDIKGAFPSVPRSKLPIVLKQRLSLTLSHMFSFFLTLDNIQTICDETRSEEMLRVGVSEGSPLSTTLLNLFMDTLGGRLSKISQSISMVPVNRIANDVLLLASAANGLQELLDICTDWARECNITRAQNKPYVLSRRPLIDQLTISRFPISHSNESTYLGVDIKWNGPTNSATYQSLNLARERLTQLGSIELVDDIHTIRARSRYVTFFRPLFKYGTAVTAPSTEQLTQIEKIQTEAASLPVRIKRSRALRCAFTIMGLPPPDY